MSTSKETGFELLQTIYMQLYLLLIYTIYLYVIFIAKAISLLHLNITTYSFILYRPKIEHYIAKQT